MSKGAIFLVILVMLIGIIFLPTTTSSATSGVQDWDSLKDQASQFIQKGKASTVISNDDVAQIVLPIGRMLVAVASGVLVVITAVMGVKYATTQSPDDQAKVKKQLIGLVVSTIVVFGGQAIWAIIYNLMKDF